MSLSLFKRHPSHLITGGWIATRIVALTPLMKNRSTTATNLVNVGPVTSKFLWLICMDGVSTEAKLRCALVCKRYSLGGSSIASLSVRNAHPHLRTPGGLHAF